MAKFEASIRGLVAAILGIAVAVGVAEALAAPGAVTWRFVLPSVLGCVLAGVLEEALFRGVVFPALARAFGGRGGGIANSRCTSTSERLPEHLLQHSFGGSATDTTPQSASPTAPLTQGSQEEQPVAKKSAGQSHNAAWKAALIQAAAFAILHLSGTLPPDLTWIVAVQAVAKVGAAFAFGICMAALYRATGSLLVPIAVHVAYNLASILPQEALHGLTTTYLTGLPADATILLATALAFIAPALVARRLLRR